MRRSRPIGLVVLLLVVAGTRSLSGQVANPLTTSFDVDKDQNGFKEITAHSEWTSTPFGGLKIKYWVDSVLPDFEPVDLRWGPLGSTGIQFKERLYANSLFSNTSTGVQWFRAPAFAVGANLVQKMSGIEFDQLSCVFFCDVSYTVMGIAKFHDLPGGSGTGTGSGSLVVEDATVTGGVLTDPIVASGGVELRALPGGGGSDERVAEFRSTVEETSPGVFEYLYEVFNDSPFPVDFDWPAVGLSDVLAADSMTTYGFTSSVAPVEITAGGTFVFDLGSDSAEFGGPTQTLVQTPEPSGLLLLGLGLMGCAARRGRAGPLEAGKGSG